MRDLSELLQELHAVMVENLLEEAKREEEEYEKVVNESGEVVYSPTGKMRWAMSRDDKMLALKLLQQNEIKAEVKQESAMGKLRERLKGKSMPRIEKDD